MKSEDIECLAWLVKALNDFVAISSGKPVLCHQFTDCKQKQVEIYYAEHRKLADHPHATEQFKQSHAIWEIIEETKNVIFKGDIKTAIHKLDKMVSATGKVHGDLFNIMTGADGIKINGAWFTLAHAHPEEGIKGVTSEMHKGTMTHINYQISKKELSESLQRNNQWRLQTTRIKEITQHEIDREIIIECFNVTPI
jgi:hypothetical protein